MKFKFDNKGVSLVEVVVVLGLLGIVSVLFMQINLMYLKRVNSDSNQIKANSIIVETMEALRFIKESDWNNLSDLTPEDTYYLSFSETDKKWNIESNNPGKIDGIFLRSFKVFEVHRDYSNSKISKNGEIDYGTLELEVNIDWTENGSPKNLKVKSYMASY